jgi:hypothetical protein
LPSSSFILFFAVPEGFQCLSRNDWLLEIPVTSALCKPLKEEVVQMKRFIEIPSGHQLNRIFLKIKCQNGFFPTPEGKIQELTRFWIFQTTTWKWVDNKVE